MAIRDILDALVVRLLEKETLLKDEIDELFADVKLISPRPAWTGSPNRTPSDLPPVALSPANSLETATSVVSEVKPKAARKPRKKAVAPTPDAPIANVADTEPITDEVTPQGE